MVRALVDQPAGHDSEGAAIAGGENADREPVPHILRHEADHAIERQPAKQRAEEYRVQQR